MGCCGATGLEERPPAASERRRPCRLPRGYSVRHFLADTFLPTDALAVMGPGDEGSRRGRLLASKLFRYDRKCRAARAAGGRASCQAGRQAGASGCPPRSGSSLDVSRPPASAICRVRLTGLDVGAGDGAALDLGVGAAVEVRLTGALLFAPSAEWAGPPDDHSRALLPADPEEAHVLPVQVWALLTSEHTTSAEVLAGAGLCPGAEGCRIHCKHLVLEREAEYGGDALADLWMPSKDILQSIELCLNRKLLYSVLGERDTRMLLREVDRKENGHGGSPAEMGRRAAPPHWAAPRGLSGACHRGA